MLKDVTESWTPVAHAYNPSYSGGRDYEDCSSKSALAKSSQDPISKKLITKKVGGVFQVVRWPAKQV
jgi:hypothetical protein